MKTKRTGVIEPINNHWNYFARSEILTEKLNEVIEHINKYSCCYSHHRPECINSDEDLDATPKE